MGDPVVKIDGLVREFGKQQALSGVTLSVSDEAGIVALLGPNGAGKTTLMAILAGLLEPTFGTVELFGHRAFPPRSDVLRQVAVVLDGCTPPRWADLSVMLDLKAGADSGFDRDRAVSLLSRRGLHLERNWSSLSKGQRHFSLATLAVCSSAKLLLLDEPADGLDPEARRDLYAILREQANERGTTVLLASHILSDMERIADRVVVLESGLVRLDESLETLREEVAEVELTSLLVDLPADAELVGRQATSDGEVVWLRYRDERSQWREQTLPGERTRRGAGLESVYTAVPNQDERV
jgi:ABC-2 type transport system ATP-binding protein